MSNQDDLKRLKKGVEAWNKWRDAHPEVCPDLRMADLSGAKLHRTKIQRLSPSELALFGAAPFGVDLSGASLEEADLSGANLSWANLRAAYLKHANLRKANLSWANLRGANLIDADLTGANLKGANLRKANLRGLNLKHANFEEADLRGASLEEADLSGTILSKANLSNANLMEAKFQKLEEEGNTILEGTKMWGANLRNCDLQETIGLTAEALGGANVTGAKLPSDIEEFKGLELVANVSKHARGIFLSAIGACLYSWLTIGTTLDLNLLLNSASKELPIIQTGVPIASFYLVAPTILFFLYLYLHFYLERMWRALAGLPAVFQDGRTLEERAYPWMLTSLVTKHMPVLAVKEYRHPLWWAPFLTSLMSAWWLVPFTLFLFWLRFLPLHDWMGTSFQLILLAASIWVGATYYHFASILLRGTGDVPRSYWRPSIYALSIFFVAGLASMQVFSYQPLAQGFSFAFLDLSQAELEGADLHGRNLNGANLTLANLRWVNLSGANLKGANLTGAFGVRATLSEANLSGADLSEAKLSGADLSDAILNEADLFGADLSGADLRIADLTGAILIDADLSGANLSDADLIDADLTGADLSIAHLNGANLIDADLTGANLIDADLTGANLKGANLTGAIIMQEQLDTACGDDDTKLPLGRGIKACPPPTQEPSEG